MPVSLRLRAGARGGRLARLGRPKQLLPYRDGTLLGHVVGTARACGFDQLVVAIGGVGRRGARERGPERRRRRRQRRLRRGLLVVDRRGARRGGPALRRAGADARRPARRDARAPWRRCWPGAATRRWPCAATTTAAGTRSRSPAAVFGDARRRSTATRACGGCSTGAARRWSEVPRRGADPARRRHPGGLRGGARRMSEARTRSAGSCPTSRRSPSASAGVDYLVDEGLATSMFLSLRLPQPLLLEGEAGVGKTEAAQVAGGRAGHPADPPPVLRGHRLGRGAVRVELPPPAAQHPAGRRGRRGAQRGDAVRRRTT